jgi:anti-sigma B factor antagonist
MLDGKTRVIGDNLAFIYLLGRLVLGPETHAFRNLMKDLIKKRPKYIVLDLEGLEGMDCAGLGELVKCRAEAELAGSTLTLQNLPRRVEDLLLITRVVALFGWSELDSQLAA